MRATANSQSVGCKNWPQKHYRAAGNCSWGSEFLPPTTAVLLCWFGEWYPFSCYTKFIRWFSWQLTVQLTKTLLQRSDTSWM